VDGLVGVLCRCIYVVGMRRVHWLAIVSSFTADTTATSCWPTRLYLTSVRLSCQRENSHELNYALITASTQTHTGLTVL